MTSSTTNSIEKLFPPLVVGTNGVEPYILLAEDAGVGPLRNIELDAHLGPSEGVLFDTTRTSSKNEQLEDKNSEHQTQQQEERLLCYLKTTEVSLSLPQKRFSDARGKIIVTTKRMFFVAQNEKESSLDFAIHAHGISLHALMSEPTHSVYCQLSDSSITADSSDMEHEFSTEVVIQPLIHNDDDHSKNKQEDVQSSKLCQVLFDSLSKLINMNPIYDNDDDDDNDNHEGGFGSGGGLAAMLGFLSGDSSAVVYGDDDNDSDDMVYRLDSNPKHSVGNNGTGEEVSQDQRARMLNHLDNLLVVPPEYDLDGQFEDADEDVEGENTDASQDDIL